VKIKKIYELAVQAGMAADPRGMAAIKSLLADEKTKFNALDTKEKEYFDTDRLWNPYADSRVLWGDQQTDVKTVAVGIDIDVGEMVLVDRLRQKGTRIDAVIGHHPEGHALAHFYEVMDIQTDMFRSHGIAVSVAESLTKERMSEVGRSVSGANHMKTVDAARLLDIPFMCIHTPADNHVARFLQNMFNKKKPAKLKHVLDILKDIPEYSLARKYSGGPAILQGTPDAQAGKIFVDMTGGTEGSRDIFSRLVASGISTLVCMHLSENHFKKAKEERINIVNAGHIASDNVGLNLLLDTVCAGGKITVVDASGFRRVCRA
jgi:hypothetical protein